MLETATPDGKARAIASNDWRGTASGSPSSDATVKKNTVTTAKHSSVENNGLCPSLAVEIEKLPPDCIQYRRPREKQVAWETVLSAPAGQLPSSPLSTPGLDPKEVAMVRLKQIHPLVMSVNGEDIPLPNRFYFEVMPVDSATSREHELPGTPLGELRKLKTPTSFQRTPAEGFHDLLDHLQDALFFDQGSSGTEDSAFSSVQRFSRSTTSSDRKDSSSSAKSAVPPAGCNADHARARLSMEEEARFQGMLSRLRKEVPPPPTAKPAGGTKTLSSRINDPAIIAIKVKEKGNAVGRDGDSGMMKGPANHVPEQHLRDVRTTAHKPPSRSGIPVASGRSGATPASQRSNERPTEDFQTKRLNPAAAEFRSTVEDGIPCFSPKTSRFPLSNIFTNVMPNHIPPPLGIPLAVLPPDLHRQTVGMAVEGKSAPSVLASVEAQLAASQTMLPPLEFGTTTNGIFPGALPPVDALIRPVITPSLFSASLSGTTVHTSPLLASFGTYPSATTSNATINVPYLGAPTATNTMNTFPPSSGTTPVPVLLAATATTATTPCSQELQQQPQGQQQHQHQQQQPPQPLIGPPGKANSARPFFPVTQKPRDHDPVKQQLYEAYLEWRKANEPGYHMKCKMRQAHRVVRQFQKKHEQQAEVESTNNSGSGKSGNNDRSGGNSGDSETAA